MTVTHDVAPGGRHLATVIRTVHDGYEAVSAVHQRRHGRRQGGVRFVRDGSLEELAHLAHGMTEKAAAAGAGIDGMKALIICPSGAPENPDIRAGMLAAHIERAVTVDPLMVFGPDMGCAEAVLDRVAVSHGLTRHVTGLSRRHGGLDIDRNGLTAYGIDVALASALDTIEGARVAIQGFGAVGAPLARTLHGRGARLVALSTVDGVLIDERGIDVPRLWPHWRRHGDRALRLFAASSTSRFHPDPDRLLFTPADVFVPAARTSVLGLDTELPHLRRENPRAMSIEAYLDRTGVHVIVEAANHPLSFAAETCAESRGVCVLPDILVNGGGMIGCCFEYDHRQRLLDEPGWYDAALDACRDRIRQTVRANLRGLEAGMSAQQLRRKALEGGDDARPDA